MWKRTLMAIGGAAAIAGVGLVAPAEADAIQSWVHVWANDVNVRSCASTSCSKVGQIDAGSYPYVCEKKGQEVHYGSYYNYWWAKIDIDKNHDGYYETPGWVNDVFLTGGGNNQKAGPGYSC